jgi:hypothetical protein
MSIVKLNNRAVKDATAVGSITGLGNLVLISRSTASSSSSVSITSGLTSTYKEYIFIYNNIHPSANIPMWTFQGSTDGGSSFGVNITSTTFNAYHAENDSEATLEYSGGGDLAQSTSYQRLLTEVNYSDDGSVSGSLHLFEPSSTTFVKHFIANSQGMFGPTSNPYSWNMYTAGYFNTTSAINAIDFKMSSGNIDSGVIKLYGVS